MALVVLLLWLTTAVIGALVLLAWVRRARPGTLPLTTITAHVTVILVALGLWIGFVVTDRNALAWSSFVVLNFGNGLGDAILTQRWRSVAGPGQRWWKVYRIALHAFLRGQWPKGPMAHALIGGITFIGSLAACLLTLA